MGDFVPVHPDLIVRTNATSEKPCHGTKLLGIFASPPGKSASLAAQSATTFLLVDLFVLWPRFDAVTPTYWVHSSMISKLACSCGSRKCSFWGQEAKPLIGVDRRMGADPTRRAAIFGLGWRSVLASGFRLQIRHFNPELYCRKCQNVEGMKNICMGGNNNIISRSCLSFIQDFK